MGDLVRNANVPLSLYRSYDSGDLTEVPPEFIEPKWLARPLEEDEATNQSGRVVRRYDIYLVSLLRGGLLLAEFLERGGEDLERARDLGLAHNQRRHEPHDARAGGDE